MNLQNEELEFLDEMSRTELSESDIEQLLIEEHNKAMVRAHSLAMHYAGEF